MKKKTSKRRILVRGVAGSPRMTEKPETKPALDDRERLRSWELDFRKAAAADKHEILRQHLQNFALPDRPKLLLEGTILVVRACVAYASLNGQPSAGPRILKMQKYDPADAADAKYAVTFDMFGKCYARVLAPPGLWPLDLADLHLHPWSRYRACGYRRIWITRTDWNDFAGRERDRLQRAVIDDLRFDYTEEELDISFEEEYEEEERQFIEDEFGGVDSPEYWRQLGCPVGALLVKVQDLTDYENWAPNTNFFRTRLALRWLEGPAVASKPKGGVKRIRLTKGRFAKKPADKSDARRRTHGGTADN